MSQFKIVIHDSQETPQMNTHQDHVSEQRFSNINQWMRTGKQTDLPPALQGIFFMDGNTLPDDCITLDARWNANTRTLKVPVYGAGQWTFHPSAGGRRLLGLVQALKLVYVMTFADETFRHAVVVPKALGIPMPRWILEFTATQTVDSVSGETWERKNTMLFGLIPAGGYTLRKIVDPEGQPLPAFEQMLPQLVYPTCLIVSSETDQ